MKDNVTVLIRCYNQEQYLYDCIRRLGDVPYKILFDYPPSGKRDRLNNAIQYIKTEWIAFNDADDMSMDFRFFCSNDSDADLLYSDCFVISKNGFNYYESKPFDRKLLKKENYIPFSTIIVRTEIAKQVPFALDVGNKGEDWIWLNDVANITDKFIYKPIPTMIYRDFSTPYGKIPVVRKIKRILWKHKIRRIINART